MNETPKGAGETERQLVSTTVTLPARRDAYLSGYGEGVIDVQEETSGLNLLEYWRIFNRRKWLILGITGGMLALGAVRTLMETPLYTATVRLQVDPVAKIVEGGDVIGGEDAEGGWLTQREILLSRTMAQRVVSSLKLGNDPNFLKARDVSIFGGILGLLKPLATSGGADEIARERAATSVVLANRSVQPIFGSRLVDISYSDPDPLQAQQIANVYADAFIASNQDKRFQANASAKIFLEDKIEQLKRRLADSEKELVAFAEKQEIVAVQEKESITESNLATASQTGTQAIAHLRSQRNDLVLQYEEKLKIFKPKYPSMVQIKAKIEEVDRQLEAEAETMRSRVETLKRELLDLQKRSIQYNILKREVDTNRDLYTSLLQRYKEVDVASGVAANNVFVVDQAGRPGSPSSPRLGRSLLWALGLGLAISLAAVYVLERVDDKVRSPEDAEQLTGLPILGVIPNTKDVGEQLTDLRSPLCEAYRSLCTALQLTSEAGLPKSLVLTSAGPSEGKSVTAMAIAKHFATLGRKVLLIDADLRNPSLHVKLNCETVMGLSNYLTGACTPPDSMRATKVPGLVFMAAGPLPPNAADLLGGPRFLSLLSIGSEVFDLIVIDGPPILGLADAQLLSSAAAATVFVIGAGGARTGIIRGGLKRLRLARGSVIGTVLTKFDAKAAGYGYGYGYDYQYDYRAEAAPGGLTVRIPNGSKPQPQLTDTRKSA